MSAGKPVNTEKVAELSIGEITDRMTMSSILVKNGYGVIPGKRKKTPTGKQLDYYIGIYKGETEDE